MALACGTTPRGHCPPPHKHHMRRPVRRLEGWGWCLSQGGWIRSLSKCLGKKQHPGEGQLRPTPWHWVASHTCFLGWGPARSFLRTWSSVVSRSLLQVRIVSVSQEASETFPRIAQGLKAPRWGKICELKSPGPSRYRTRMWAKLPICL